MLTYEIESENPKTGNFILAKFLYSKDKKIFTHVFEIVDMASNGIVIHGLKRADESETKFKPIDRTFLLFQCNTSSRFYLLQSQN